MPGKLYLCPTPIGNLSDISERVLETLRAVDLIAAEDTRTSYPLLRHFDIDKPMISYHKYNEQERTPELIGRLADGAQIALITDAGMPAISDPGQILVARCHEAGIPVTALPGPCAFVTALALSGFDSRRFLFEGFLPQEKDERREALARLSESPVTTLFYEAPHRLQKTLEAMTEAAGERPCACVRELTKKFEEIRFGTVKSLAEYYRDNEPRGEFVIVVAGISREIMEQKKASAWLEMSLEDHMALYAELPEKEAMKRVAAERGLTKREVYQALKVGKDGSDAIS